MHILIGLLTAIATLLFALERLGVDIGWLNPWAWGRRRRWMKQLSVNPAFNLDSPMEAVALLLLATAKIDGDLSAEEKTALQALFVEEFNQTPEGASSLLRSSAYLLKDGETVFEQPEKVLERSIERFSADQKLSAVKMLWRIADVSGKRSDAQSAFIAKVTQLLETPTPSDGWE